VLLDQVRRNDVEREYNDRVGRCGGLPDYFQDVGAWHIDSKYGSHGGSSFFKVFCGVPLLVFLLHDRHVYGQT